VVILAVLLLSTAWCIPHMGVSYVDLNSSSIRAITHNTSSGSSSHNSSSSSVVLLLHLHSRRPSGHHSSFPLATLHASTVGRWSTLLMNAASPRKATHHELWNPWSTSRGANRGALHHELATPTTPPWMRSPRENKCYHLYSSSTNVILSYCLILEHRMIL
jgi:hypothetical protein